MWTSGQFWFIISSLANSNDGYLIYDNVKQMSLFGNKDEAIKAMERAGMIYVEYDQSHPYKISSSKLFLTGFKKIYEHTATKISFDLIMLKELIVIE